MRKWHHSYNCMLYECQHDGVRAKGRSEGTHSSLKIFLMTIVTHTFSRREPKRLLVPRVEKAKSSLDYEFVILLYFFL